VNVEVDVLEKFSHRQLPSQVWRAAFGVCATILTGAINKRCAASFSE
jgi:hypothetical protein